MKKFLLFSVMATLLYSCIIWNRTYVLDSYDKMPQTRNNNVCKTLTDSVVLYAIFVDVEIYNPWTHFDVMSTRDSIQKACHWIESKGVDFGKKVHIQPVFYEKDKKLTINEKKYKASLTINGLKVNTKRKHRKLGSWADIIAKSVGTSVKMTKTENIDKKLKIKNLQTLNLALRNNMNRENVAMMFFVNGYYENHPSITLYSNSNEHVEYSIITSKHSSVIAHEFLHLFGALDLYPNYAFPNFNYSEINKAFPNEIMNIQHNEIEKLMISPITSYFIGWQDTLDYKNTRLLLHKLRLPEY